MDDLKSNLKATIDSNARNSTELRHWQFVRSFLDGMYLKATTNELNDPLKTMKLEDSTETDDIAEEVKKRLEEVYSSSEENFDNSTSLVSDDILFSEEEILNEFEKLKTNDEVGVILDIAKEYAKETTSYFNNLLTTGSIPEEWKTILFKLPNQAVTIKTIEEYKFKAYPTLFATVYTNILARELDIKSDNIMMTINLLIEVFQKKKQPLYFLIIEFPEAFERVKLSTVREAFDHRGIADRLCSLFYDLLEDAKLEIVVGDERITVSKRRGLHFEDVANKALMALVMRMILKEELNDDDDDEDEGDEDEGDEDEGDEDEGDEDEGEDDENQSEDGEDEDEDAESEEGENEDKDEKDHGEEERDEKQDEKEKEKEDLKNEALPDMLKRLNVKNDESVSSQSTQQEDTSKAHSKIIEDSFKKAFYFDNKIVVVDTDSKTLISRSCALLDVAKKHELENHEIHVFTNDSTRVGETFTFGEVKTQSTNNFRCSYFSKGENPISDLLSDAAQKRREADKMAKYAKMPKFQSKSENDKEEFFHYQLLPSLLYNCQAWKSTDEEMEALTEVVKNFRNGSGLSLSFDVHEEIQEKKEKWLRDHKKVVKKLLEELNCLEM
uniref:VWFA domain-containing protein n=1 Tax=Caenorhabditis tropicalis TaxID=1561998 RepID=A0A1I7UP41_9PELO